MTWTSVLARRDTGAPIGELGGFRDRKVRHAFNGRAKTASGTLRLDNPLVDTVLGGSVLLKAYDGATLRFVGPLQSFEETASGDGGSVAVTFADPLAVFLGKRLVGKSSAGYVDGDALNTRDRSTLVTNLLAAANASAYTHVDAGTVVATGSSSYLNLGPYANALAGITGVVNTLNGPDVELVLQEPQAVAAGLRYGLLNVAPVIGTVRSDVVFEYGYGRRNVASYRRAGDLSIMLNRAYGLPSTADTAASVVTASDAASITAWDVLEDVVPSDLGTDALRQATVDEHVRIRKAPRVLVSFSPVRNDVARPGRVPQYGADFNLGDVVRFRAVSQTRSVRVDALLRVYAVDWTIDNEGASVPEFTLTAD